MFSTLTSPTLRGSMRKNVYLYSVCSAVVLVGLGITPEIAAGQKSIGFGITAGAALPMGDLKPLEAGTGWYAGAILNWNNAISSMGVRFEAVYDAFGLADEPSSSDQEEFPEFDGRN